MKAKHFISLLLLTFSISFYAQGERKEKIKALKIAHITKDLALTTSEAEKFWPIYNTFDEKQFELRMIRMRKIKVELDSKPIESLTDSEANALLTQLENLEMEALQNRKKLMIDLRKVISPVKMLKLKQAEDSFNKTLLNQYKRRN